MNPLFFTYNSVANVAQYAKPTAVFIAHKNREDAEFQRARDKSAEVYAYFNVVETPNGRVSQLWEDFYMGSSVSVPRWFSPTGEPRVNYPNTQMLDIRIGSVWVNHAIDYLSKIAASGRWDGLFLDVIGGQLWGADFRSWPQAERDEWTAGAVDLVRRLREAVGDFIIVNNNTWQKALHAEQYVNGICIEHPTATNSAFLQGYANHAYGHKRRVLVITRSETEAAIWETVPGVTHLGAMSGYGTASPPVVEYEDLRVPELRAQLTALQAKLEISNEALKTAIQEGIRLSSERAAFEKKLQQITQIVNTP